MSIPLMFLIAWSSAALAILSVVAMIWLILRRIYNDRRFQISLKRRKALLMFVTLYLSGSADVAHVRAHCRNIDIRMLEDVGRSIVEGGCSHKQIRADLDLLNEIVQDLVGTIRGASRERISSLIRETMARQVSLEDLDSKHPARRIDAIELLSLIPDPEIVGALRRKLDDPEMHVRLAATSALVTVDDTLTLDELVEKLDIGVTVRSRALRHIFSRFASRDRASVIRLLNYHPSDLVTTLAVYGLGATQDYSVISIVERFMESPSINVRAETMRALARIGHPDAGPAVLRGLNDAAWEVRTEAAICAGRISLTQAAPLLRKRLADEEWWPRFRAAEALMAMGGAGRIMLERARLGRDQAARMSDMILAESRVAA